MSSARANRLRQRLSIDPDQIAAPQPAPRAPLQPVEATPEPAAAPQSPTEPDVAQKPTQSTPAAEEPARQRGSGARASTRKSSGPNWETCLDDPAILEGRHGYRSFYIDDVTFARFRSAIYWLARREETAGEVPENMSVAVQEFMEATASDLEARHNGSRPFRPTPEQLKAAKRRSKSTE